MRGHSYLSLDQLFAGRPNVTGVSRNDPAKVSVDAEGFPGRVPGTLVGVPE